MKITDIFKQQEKTFSFEFFPPKDEISAIEFGVNAGQLMRLNPSFISITYGAGGSNQERTFNLVDLFQNKLGLTTMAHYTCVNATQDKIKSDLEHLSKHNIENLMLLRGDPPVGQKVFVPFEQGFGYASDLIGFAKKLGGFSIGAGAYPEKHPEATSIANDINSLKKKVDAGADFLITQLFFDNKVYFKFKEQVKQNGINCRIIPGIIPITSYNQVKRFVDMSGAAIPIDLREKLEAHKEDDKKIYQIGLEYAIHQCQDLLKQGAPGIHFYTLNKSRAAIEIYESIEKL